MRHCRLTVDNRHRESYCKTNPCCHACMNYKKCKYPCLNHPDKCGCVVQGVEYSKFSTSKRKVVEQWKDGHFVQRFDSIISASRWCSIHLLTMERELQTKLYKKTELNWKGYTWKVVLEE